MKAKELVLLLALATGAPFGVNGRCHGSGFWNGGPEFLSGQSQEESAVDNIRSCRTWNECYSRCTMLSNAEYAPCIGACMTYWMSCFPHDSNYYSGPICSNNPTCGHWHDAEEGTGCDIPVHRLNWLGYMTESACRDACAGNGASCCERYLDNGLYSCYSSYVTRVRNWGASGTKGVTCSRSALSELEERVEGERPNEDAAPDTKGELTTKEALVAAPVRKAVPRPRGRGREKTVSELVEANTELEAELAALRRAAAEEEEEEEELEKTIEELKKANAELKKASAALEMELAAKKDAKDDSDSSPDKRGALFVTVNAIHAMLRDDAVEGERGAVPAGEGGLP